MSQPSLHLTIDIPRRPHSCLAAFLVFVCLALASPVHGKIFYVGIGEGCNASTPEAALLGALLSGSESDEIRLTHNLYNVKLKIENWDPSTVGPLTIRGGYSDCLDTTPGSGTHLYGGPDAPVIEVLSTGAVTSQVRLDRVILRGASNHRGLRVDGSAAQAFLTRSTLRENHGGASVTGGGSLVIGSTTVIWLNDAGSGQGGGVLCDASYVESGALISQNRAGTGGGIHLANGCRFKLAMGASVIDNEANWGGGVSLTGDETYLPTDSRTNSGIEISHNVAHREGGGIWAVHRSHAVLYDVHVRANSAGQKGGGIFASDDATVQMVRSNYECSGSRRCSWLEGNGVTATYEEPDYEQWPGLAGYVERAGKIVLRGTFVEGHWASERAGYLFFASGAGSLIDLATVQIANNDSRILFYATDYSATSARYISAAGNFFEGVTGAARPSSGAWSTHEASIDIASSVFVDVGLFSTSDTYYNGVSLDCLLVSDLTTNGEVETSRITVGADPLFLDVASGDLRVPDRSPVVDYCDDEVVGSEIETIDLRPRGDDVANVPDLFGPNDLGVHEVHGFAFMDNFESGDLSVWN